MINWKVRFKNAVWLSSFIAFIVSTIYQLLSLLGITASIDQESVMQLIATVLQILSLMGVIVDPTTKGLGDSERALKYEEPN